MVLDRQLSRRRVLAGAAASLTALSGCGALDDGTQPGTDDSTEWPFHGGDRAGSAYVPDAAAPREGATERWSVETGWVSDRPVVAEGLVLLPTAEALVAHDAESGEEVWRYSTDEQAWFSSPAVVDGTVYVGFRRERGLAALSADDGSVRWRADVGRVSAPPLADDDGNAFVGGRNGWLAMVGPDGSVEWRYDLFGEVTTLATRTPTVAPTAVAGTAAGEVYSLYDTGEGPVGLWRRKLGGKVLSMAVGDGGDVYTSTFGGTLRRLANGAHAGSDRWANRDGGTAEGGLVLADSVFGANLAGLTACNARTGDTEWSVHAGNAYDFTCAPAAAGDTLYAGREDEVVAYRLGGGLGVGDTRIEPTRWRYGLDSAPTEGLAVADGALFAATTGGENVPPRLVALDPA